MRCLLINVFALLLFVCAPVMALNSDRQQSIYIESDELEVDDLRGVSEYRGSVSFSQGSIQLEADKVLVFGSKQQLDKVIAHGGPVYLSQTMEADKGVMRAVARTIEYLASKNSLFLQGDAKLWQGGNEFRGEKITYHLKNETVVASGGEKQDSRVHIVIQPKEGASELKDKGAVRP